MKSATIVLLTVLALVAAACDVSPDTSSPPDIAYGSDVCDRCNMIISEERFAAAYWTTAGNARRFDDVGGMMAYFHEEREEVATFWVHGYAAGEWIQADEATFAFVPDVITPMGFGLVAFASPAQAQAMVTGQEDALVLTFDQLLTEAEQGNVDFFAHPPHSGDEDDQS